MNAYYTILAILALSVNVFAEDEELKFKQLSFHPLHGTIKITDDSTITVKNFTYDGEGPDAFFLISTETDNPSSNSSVPVPYPPFKPNTPRKYTDRSIPILGKFSGANFELKMPEGINANEVRWLSVFCRDYDTDFGSVIIKKNKSK